MSDYMLAAARGMRMVRDGGFEKTAGVTDFFEKSVADKARDALGSVGWGKAGLVGGGLGGAGAAGMAIHKIHGVGQLDHAAADALHAQADAHVATAAADGGRALTNTEHDVVTRSKTRKIMENAYGDKAGANSLQDANGVFKPWHQLAQDSRARQAHGTWIATKAAKGAAAGTVAHGAGQAVAGHMQRSKIQEYAVPAAIGAAGLAGIAAMNSN